MWWVNPWASWFRALRVSLWKLFVASQLAQLLAIKVCYLNRSRNFRWKLLYDIIYTSAATVTSEHYLRQRFFREDFLQRSYDKGVVTQVPARVADHRWLKQTEAVKKRLNWNSLLVSMRPSRNGFAGWAIFKRDLTDVTIYVLSGTGYPPRKSRPGWYKTRWQKTNARKMEVTVKLKFRTASSKVPILK
jgi:hypothetical protein